LPVGLAIALLLLVVVSSCGGPAQATSWPGLTVVDGIAYAADLDQVRALDAETGASLWAYPVDVKEARRGFFYITPAVDDERVIVASASPGGGFFSQPQNVVWALDRDGRELWSYRGAEGQFVEGGAISGGMFVIGNSDGNVYALDLENGQLRWKFGTGHRVWAKPLIVGDVVYIGSMDRSLYALSLSNGAELWRFAAGGAFAGTPALLDGTLFIGAFNARFYALDAEDGTELWHAQSEDDDWFWGSPVVNNNVVYAADVNGTVYALDVDTGEQIWTTSLLDDRDRPAPVRAGVALSEDGELLFVGSEIGTLYALDTAEQGRRVWAEPNEGQIFSDPIVSGDAVFQPLVRGPKRLVALLVETGRDIWDHPEQDEE
jgi:outer membrane protein assembly factor BamB